MMIFTHSLRYAPYRLNATFNFGYYTSVFGKYRCLQIRWARKETVIVLWKIK